MVYDVLSDFTRLLYRATYLHQYMLSAIIIVSINVGWPFIVAPLKINAFILYNYAHQLG